MAYILPGKTLRARPVNKPGDPYHKKCVFRYPDGVLPEDPVIIVPGQWYTPNQNTSIFDPVPNGFTQMQPVSGQRLIHYSPGGSSSGTGTAGDPTSNVQWAVEQMRDGAHDWILLEAGRDDYAFDLYSNFRRQRMCADVGIGWFGTGSRPRVIPPEPMGYTYNVGHKWIGLHLVNPYGEIGNPLFNAGLTFRNLQYLSTGGGDILVEDCESTGVELLFQDQTSSGMHDFTVRHHIGHYVFWGNSSSSVNKRPSASYVANIANMLFEYNVHDYSGWHPDIVAGTYGGQTVTGSGANSRNHCYYIGEGGPQGPTIRHNFISRPSSHGWQLRPGGEGYRNIVYYAAIGGAFGYYDSGNPTKGTLVAGRYSRMQENLFLRGNGMYRLPGSCQSGAACTSARWGLQYTLKPADSPSATFESLGNVVAETSTALTNHLSPPNPNSIREIWQLENLYTGSDPSGGRVTRSNNRFWHFTNGTEGDGQFVDPGRSIEGMFSAMAGEAMTYDQCVNVLKSRPKYTLNPAITIPAIHEYIMAGYEAA